MPIQQVDYCLQNATLITPDEVVEQGWVAVQSGTIMDHGGPDRSQPQADAIVDLEGNYLLPGLIETHLCGMVGGDFREGRSAYQAILPTLPRFATTSVVATVVSAPPKNFSKHLEVARHAMGERLGARLLGLHLEGPYLNPEYAGLSGLGVLFQPSAEVGELLTREGAGVLKIVTLSPELPGSVEMIRTLARAGIVVSASHTEADAELLELAVQAGLRHITHLFDATRPRAEKEPLVPAPGFDDLVLIEDRLTASVIADGVHVPLDLLRLALRCKGSDRLVLVTDAFAGTATNLEHVTYPDGVEVTVGPDAHRVADSGALAGSLLTLDQALRNLYKWEMADLATAVRMATVTPATLLGLQDQLGRIAPGYQADLAVLDRNLRPVMTFVGGQRVWQHE